MINKNKQSNKTLSLAERVQMINEYNSSSPKLSFEALAKKYAVSCSLIHNIILNKKLYLSTYAKSTTSNKAKSANAITKQTYVKSIECANQNDLSLLQRINVIKEYKSQVPKPTINVLARKYKVNRKQIVNILDNQKSILKLFEEAGHKTSAAVDDSSEMEIKQRKHKITFLGKALHEYYQRTLYHKIKTDNIMLLQKAKEITQCIDIKGFSPSLTWLEEFRNMYGIEEGIQTMSSPGQTAAAKVTKCCHLNTVDIVQYVVYQKCKKCDMEVANASGSVCGEKIIQQKADCQSRLQLEQVIPHEINAGIETCTDAIQVPKDHDEMITKKQQLNSLNQPERAQVIKEYNSTLTKSVSQAFTKNNNEDLLIKDVNTRSSLGSSTKDQEKSNQSVLSPEQQVAIIREYASHKPNPTLKSLAGKYNVSIDYIKNIIFHQEPILQLYQGSKLPTVSDALKDPEITDNRDTHSAWKTKSNDAIPEPGAFENSLVPNTNVLLGNNSFANCNPMANYFPQSMLNGVAAAIDGNTIQIVTSPAMSNEIGVALENVNDDAFAVSVTDNESQSTDLSFVEHISIKSEISSDAEEFLDEDSSMNPKTNEPYSLQLLNASDARIEQHHQMHDVNNPMSFQWFPNSHPSIEEKIVGQKSLANTETNAAMLKGNTARIVIEPNEKRLLQDVSKDQQRKFPAIGCMEDAMPHLNLLKDYALSKNDHGAINLVNLLAGALKRSDD